MIFAGFTAEAQYSNDGASVTTSAIAGSTGSWNNPSNAVTDDNSRAVNSSSLSGTNYTDYIVVTNFGLSVPVDETISGVEFTINKSKSGGTWAWLGDYRVYIVKAGTITGNNNASALPWFGSDGNYGYGSSSDMWGTTLTPADVNKTGFGVAIAAQRYFGFGSPTPRIDNVSVQVHVAAPLPVELTYFGIENKERVVDVNWVTNSEIENDYFEVQVSKDGFIYQNIGKIDGQGNTAEITDYQFVDKLPTEGISYYRLKQVDFDGTTAYSDVKMVDRGENQGDFVMYPNPAVNEFSISNLSEGKNVVNVINLSGQVVMNQSISNYSQIDLSSFENGIYMVSIINSKGTSTQKLVVR